MGVPTVAGEIGVDASYDGNPLVNAMCVGLIRHEDLKGANASGVGNPVILFGADTGRDGLHGATFASLEDPEASHRGVVQVGDPFMEKLLIEACLELLTKPGLVGLQDLGATGLTSSTVEAAARGSGGIRIDVERVPRRTQGLTPYEVMLSESQERMLAIVERGHEDEIIEVCHRWGLHTQAIGEVTDDDLLSVRQGHETVAELPVEMLVDAPTYRFPVERPDYLADVHVLIPDQVPLPDDLAATFLELLGSPNIASRAPVYGRYDHMVGTNTVIQPGGDAAVLRVKGTHRGVAFSTDGNGRLCYLEPREGGRIAVAEAARNVSVVGATPLAVTDCLNFGSPDDAAVYYQFAEVIEGMAEACRAFETPVVSGNVSLYNESNEAAIWPTPVVGMLGLLERLERRCDLGFVAEGDVIFGLGVTEARLAGSEYLSHVHGRVAGRPSIDLDFEVALQRLVRELIAEGLLRSAHDLAEGGLAVAVAESAFRGGIGARVEGGWLAAALRADTALFGEAQSRIIVSVAPEDAQTLERRAASEDIPCIRLGTVGGERLVIGPIDVTLDEAQAVWSSGLARALAGEG